MDTTLEVGKRVAQGSDVVGGAATGLKAAQAFQAISPFGGTAMDAFTNGSEALGAGESVLGTAGRALGPIGIGLSAATAVGHGAMLANMVSQEGAGAAYHDQKAYNEAGATGLAAAHTVLPFLGPYGEAANLALTGGELAADGAGALAGAGFGQKAAFNADSVAGGLIRGTFGDQSMGEQARQGVGNLLGHGTAANIAGGAVDGLVNAATFPAQLGATVGRGIVNEGMAIGQGIANGDGVVGHALNTAGHWVGNEASAAASGIASGARTVGTGIANGVSAAGTGLANGARAVGNGLATGATWAGNEASAAGTGLANGARAVGNGLATGATWAGNEASAVGSGIASGASTVGRGLASGASAVGSGLASAGSAVGSGIASGASAVSGAVGRVFSW